MLVAFAVLAATDPEYLASEVTRPMSSADSGPDLVRGSEPIGRCSRDALRFVWSGATSSRAARVVVLDESLEVRFRSEPTPGQELDLTDELRDRLVPGERLHWLVIIDDAPGARSIPLPLVVE